MTETSLVSRTPSAGSMIPTDPFRTFERFFGQDLFRPFGLMSRFFNEPLAGAVWSPVVDIVETDEAYEVSAELPGLTKDDVQITLENNVLTLSGERKWSSESAQQNYHRIERTYGKFSRSFALPHQVHADKVQATFRDGILYLTIPKVESARPRRIAIH